MTTYQNGDSTKTASTHLTLQGMLDELYMYDTSKRVRIRSRRLCAQDQAVLLCSAAAVCWRFFTPCSRSRRLSQLFCTTSCRSQARRRNSNMWHGYTREKRLTYVIPTSTPARSPCIRGHIFAVDIGARMRHLFVTLHARQVSTAPSRPCEQMGYQSFSDVNGVIFANVTGIAWTAGADPLVSKGFRTPISRDLPVRWEVPLMEPRMLRRCSTTSILRPLQMMVRAALRCAVWHLEYRSARAHHNFQPPILGTSTFAPACRLLPRVGDEFPLPDSRSLSGGDCASRCVMLQRSRSLRPVYHYAPNHPLLNTLRSRLPAHAGRVNIESSFVSENCRVSRPEDCKAGVASRNGLQTGVCLPDNSTGLCAPFAARHPPRRNSSQLWRTVSGDA